MCAPCRWLGRCCAAPVQSRRTPTSRCEGCPPASGGGPEICMTAPDTMLVTLLSISNVRPTLLPELTCLRMTRGLGVGDVLYCVLLAKTPELCRELKAYPAIWPGSGSRSKFT
jgi:hypothetical protein